MTNYDFRNLSPLDFEFLTQELLQKELGVRLESFSPGKDSGIDLRHCEDESNTLIIQCKHYVESGFSNLFSHLKKNELEKVIILNPKRYILVSSNNFTPNQKSKLIKLFKPFILSPNDIFGKNDLNNLLTKYPDIEKHNFKLWLSSVSILEQILHSKTMNISEESIQSIKEHAKYYVSNRSFADAIRILNEHNFCIIAGIPGIGKTTLAEMLLLHYLEQGYEVSKIYDDISEAYQLDYTNQKRIFFYDDFLGQTSSDDKLNKSEDQRILDFFHTIRRSKVSKLVLTTREYILNQASRIYEKLDRSDIRSDIYVIDLAKYTRLIRAKILFNHIYFSDLPPKYKEIVLKDKNYLKIIDHPNYNPRIINVMTKYTNFTKIPSKQYFSAFLYNLTNPLAIWQHAFENQLCQASRNLLVVIASMPKHFLIEDLETVFKQYNRIYSIEFNQSIQSSDFKKALKELEGNFIRIDKTKYNIVISFHNPSIRDFVQNYLNNANTDLFILIKSSIFFEQCLWIWGDKYRKIVASHAEVYINSLKSCFNSKNSYIPITTNEIDLTIYKDILIKSHEERMMHIVSVLKEISDPELRSYFRGLVEIMIERMRNGLVEREQLILLLREFKTLYGFLDDVFDTLNDRVRDYFLSEPNKLEDIKYYFEYHNLFPDRDNEENVCLIKDNLIKFVENNISSIDTVDEYHIVDPDAIRDDAITLSLLAESFEIDFHDDIEKLESLASEAEDKLYDTEPYEPSSKTTDIELDCKDEEINSLFSTLT